MESETAARLAALLVVALLAMPAARAAAEAPDGARIAGEAELRRALSGRTFYGRYEDGIDWIEYYAPDGRSAYWDGCTHDGDWWIADGRACFRYRGDAAGRHYCWLVYRSGGGYEFFMPDDGVSGPARAYTTAVREGNREHLPLDADDCVSARLEWHPMIYKTTMNPAFSD